MAEERSRRRVLEAQLADERAAHATTRKKLGVLRETAASASIPDPLSEPPPFAGDEDARVHYVRQVISMSANRRMLPVFSHLRAHAARMRMVDHATQVGREHARLRAILAWKERHTQASISRAVVVSGTYMSLLFAMRAWRANGALRRDLKKYG